MTEFDMELDLKGLSCPMPILKLTKHVKGMDQGQVVKMIGTDPGSVDDVPKWVKRKKHELLASEEVDGNYIFYIKKN